MCDHHESALLVVLSSLLDQSCYMARELSVRSLQTLRVGFLVNIKPLFSSSKRFSKRSTSAFATYARMLCTLHSSSPAQHCQHVHITEAIYFRSFWVLAIILPMTGADRFLRGGRARSVLGGSTWTIKKSDCNLLANLLSLEYCYPVPEKGEIDWAFKFVSGANRSDNTMPSSCTLTMAYYNILFYQGKLT